MVENATELLRMTNVEEGKKLLAVIHRVEGRQAYWKEFLEEVYRTEAEQEAKSMELTRAVLVEEAESLTSAKFVTWLHEKQPTGVGQESIADWFHLDALALETPFVAMVPYPHSMKTESVAFFKESVDELLFDAGETTTSDPSSSTNKRCYVYTVAPRQSHAALLNLLVPVAQPEKSARPPYTRTICRSGADVVALCQSDGELASALKEVPCVFMAQNPIPFCRVAKIAVVGGVLVAVQLDTRLEDNAHEARDLNALTTFTFDAMVSALRGRTFYAVVGLIPSPQRPGGRRWVLVSVGSLSGDELESFADEELAMVARVLAPHYRRRARDEAPAGMLPNWSPVCRYASTDYDVSIGGGAGAGDAMGAPPSDADTQTAADVVRLRLAKELRAAIDRSGGFQSDARASQAVERIEQERAAAAAHGADGADARPAAGAAGTVPTATTRAGGSGHSTSTLIGAVVASAALSLGAALFLAKVQRGGT